MRPRDSKGRLIFHDNPKQRRLPPTYRRRLLREQDSAGWTRQEDGSVLVPLTRGKFSAVDEADIPLIEGYVWRASVKRNANFELWYARSVERGSKDVIISMHRLIMGAKKGEMIDHKDHDGLNNRRSNMRVATPRQNSANARSGVRKISAYRGVHYSIRYKKWYAAVGGAKRRRNGSLTSDPIKAAQDYDRMAVEMFGEFAVLNFPASWRAGLNAILAAEGKDG